MEIVKGDYIFTGGLRKKSIAIGFQITKTSFDIDLVFCWFAIERMNWK
jgi:hypothetical protein